MMKSRNTNVRSGAARTNRYAWLAAVTLIAALIVGSAAGVPRAAASSEGVARGVDASASRYQALGEYYLARADADTARWVSLGQFYAQSSTDAEYTDVSWFYVERMRAQAAQSSGTTAYTDVSRFYVERMRAQARDAAGLAANPELAFARRSYHATGDELALNPELLIARGRYRLAAGSCMVEDARMSENPELFTVRQARGC